MAEVVTATTSRPYVSQRTFPCDEVVPSKACEDAMFSTAVTWMQRAKHAQAALDAKRVLTSSIGVAPVSTGKSDELPTFGLILGLAAGLIVAFGAGYATRLLVKSD